MKNIIDKLNKLPDSKYPWNNWSSEEIKKLLDIYYIISKKESQIFKLIYRYHGCDSWEDIFRDYDIDYLEDKTSGVEIALDEINKIVNKNK